MFVSAINSPLKRGGRSYGGMLGNTACWETRHDGKEGVEHKRRLQRLHKTYFIWSMGLLKMFGILINNTVEFIKRISMRHFKI